MSQPFLHIISDYGVNDPAFGEVIQRLHAQTHDLNPHIYPTSTNFSDTIAGGFWIYQYLLGKNSDQSLFCYSNIAPRKEQIEAMSNNAGEGLKYAKLQNGAEIIAVNSTHIFSFVKPHLAEFRDINVSNQGTQFRSRDNYIPVVSQIMHGNYQSLDNHIDPNLIPDAPSSHIAWIDGYGNIKTTIRRSQVSFKPGSKVRITINQITWTAIVADGSFSVAHGEIAFAPGSSGYEDPFMEIFLRRHLPQDVSAANVFNNPFNGAEISIKTQ